MASPLVSVVIPAFRQAAYLPEAIQSVLSQTYGRLEAIVVDDASPDETSEVVRRYADERVRLIIHHTNQGLPAARNTAMRNSNGELIAFLDADDVFHPEKIAQHVVFHRGNPDVGATYNARFNWNHSAKTIRDLWRPPAAVGLCEFVLGWPFAPSDMVVRRDWAFRVNLFDEQFRWGGEDVEFPCRLALAGCRFAGIDRALNYRRYHSGRQKRNLAARVKDYEDALGRTFADSACPPDVRALRGLALANHYSEVLFFALTQDERELSHRLYRDIAGLSPEYMAGEPCRLVRSLLTAAIQDESRDHEALLERVFSQLAQERPGLRRQYDWAVGQGFLRRAVRASIWGRSSDAGAHFLRAANCVRRIDKDFIGAVTADLLSYEKEFGPDSALPIAAGLKRQLAHHWGSACGRQLIGLYCVNRAFESYRCGNHAAALKNALLAMMQDRKHITNRGVLSLLGRSSAGWLRG